MLRIIVICCCVIPALFAFFAYIHYWKGAAVQKNDGQKLFCCCEVVSGKSCHLPESFLLQRMWYGVKSTPYQINAQYKKQIADALPYVSYRADKEVLTTVLYEAYLDWCEQNDVEEINYIPFAKRLAEMEDELEISASKHIDGDKRGFVGIGIASEK